MSTVQVMTSVDLRLTVQMISILSVKTMPVYSCLVLRKTIARSTLNVSREHT